MFESYVDNERLLVPRDASGPSCPSDASSLLAGLVKVVDEVVPSASYVLCLAEWNNNSIPCTGLSPFDVTSGKRRDVYDLKLTYPLHCPIYHFCAPSKELELMPKMPRGLRCVTLRA